jgi:hypothetical protein
MQAYQARPTLQPPQQNASPPQEHQSKTPAFEAVYTSDSELDSEPAARWYSTAASARAASSSRCNCGSADCSFVLLLSTGPKKLWNPIERVGCPKLWSLNA